MNARADLPDGGRGFEECHLVPGLAEAVRGGESAHSAPDDEDVELVRGLATVVEGGANGGALRVRCGVGRREGMGVAWRGGHSERGPGGHQEESDAGPGRNRTSTATAFRCAWYMRQYIFWRRDAERTPSSAGGDSRRACRTSPRRTGIRPAPVVLSSECPHGSPPSLQPAEKALTAQGKLISSFVTSD